MAIAAIIISPRCRLLLLITLLLTISSSSFSHSRYRYLSKTPLLQGNPPVRYRNLQQQQQQRPQFALSSKHFPCYSQHLHLHRMTTTTMSSMHEDMNNHPSSSTKPPTLTYVEFYSGVGGWTMALHEALQVFQQQCHDGRRSFKLQRLANLDHSDLCQTVLEYNFPLQQESKSLDKKRKRQIISKSNPPPKSKKPARTYSLSIERLSLKQVEQWKADLYVMSPPCQPHTRQHSNQQEDLQDPRSKSFLHLCDLLSTMKDETLPRLILMENVVGFEKSGSCERWRQVMSQRNYHVGHFHVNPTQIGIPNDRPRYYSVAVLQEEGGSRSSRNDWYTNYLSKEEVGSPRKDDDNTTTKENLNKEDAVVSTKSTLPPIHIQTSIMPLGVYPLDQVVVSQEDDGDDDENGSNDKSSSSLLKVQPISNFLDPSPPTTASVEGDKNSNNNHHEDDNHQHQFQSSSLSSSSLTIPTKLLQKSAAWCFDIVTPSDGRSACFTHAYGKYIKGTGSILYTGPSTGNFQLEDPSKRQYDANWYETKVSATIENGQNAEQQQQQEQHHLRYFSGTEIARLLGFPILNTKNDSLGKELNNVGDDVDGGGPVQSDETSSSSSPLSFTFPDSCTLKQQWKLLGNSINVKVASKIVLLGLRNMMMDDGDDRAIEIDKD